MYKKRQPKEFMQNDRALGCCFYKIKKCVNVLYKSKCYSIVNTYNKPKPLALRAFINKDSLTPITLYFSIYKQKD